MSRTLLIIGLVAAPLGLVGCKGSNTKSRRTGSAAPVEMITQPQLGDGGTAGTGTMTDEIEPNDGEDVATPVALGAIGRGRITSDSDTDYYRVEVDKPGVLQVSLSGVEGMDLSLELLDGTGASVGKSERSGARIREGIPNAGVMAGKYVLVVKQAAKKKPKAAKAAKKGAATVDAGVGSGSAGSADAVASTAPVYELVAQLVPLAAGGEREPDDDRGTANELIVADNAVGFVGWSGDKDVWKLSVETLSDKNALDVQVSAVEGVALELEVTDGIGTVLATRKAARGQVLTLQNMLPVVPEGAPPFYYLTVRGDRSNPETPYTLHAKANVLGPDPELEPNDNIDKPQVIAADRTVVHASWTPGDIDCFTVPPAPQDRVLEFTIDTPADIDLAAELIGFDNKVVAASNKGKKGVAETVTLTVAANSKIVLRVKNPDAAAMSGEAKYDVKVSELSGTGDNAP
jgi:hypothetical protein